MIQLWYSRVRNAKLLTLYKHHLPLEERTTTAVKRVVVKSFRLAGPLVIESHRYINMKALGFLVVVFIDLVTTVYYAYAFQYGWNHFVVLLPFAIPRLTAVLPIAGAILCYGLLHTRSLKDQPDVIELCVMRVVQPSVLLIFMWILTWFL